MFEFINVIKEEVLIRDGFIIVYDEYGVVLVGMLCVFIILF